MAITKIQAGALPADVITTAAIDDASITHAKLHTTMDLSGKTVTLPTLSTLNTSGNVGIGTSSPNSPLEVSNGTENHRIAFSTGEVFQMARNASAYITQKYIANQHVFTGYGDNSSNEAMRIDGSGNIKFGPNGEGYINGAAQNTYNSGFNVNADDFSTWINYSGYQGGSTKFRDLVIGNGKGGRVVTIDGSSGNVGINSSNPSAKLTVEGTFSVRTSSYQSFNDSNNANNLTMTDSKSHFNLDGADKDFQISSDTVTHALFVQGSDGNVGIGTTTPSAELDVNGDIRGNSFNGVSTGTRNLLINGDMQIAQRSTNAVLSTNAYQYAALDRWGNYYNGNQIQRTSVDIASSGGGTPNKNAMRITRASSNGHLYTFQFLEGLGRLLRINTPFSVSFKARASKSGDAVVQMRYGNSGAASTATDNEIDGSVSLTTSWQTFKYDNLTHNRDYTNAGIWFWGVDSNFAAVGDWIEITDFQLELGPKCTPYEQKTEGMEFLACMRYYQKLDAIHLSGSSSGDHGIFMGHVWGAGIIYFVHHFNVPMRTGPTLKLGQSQGSTGNWFSGGSVVQTGSLMRIQSANQYKAEMSSSLAQSSFTPGNSCWMRLYNSSAWLAFDAEL